MAITARIDAETVQLRAGDRIGGITIGAAGLSVRVRNREQLKHHHPDTVVCHRRLEGKSEQGSVTKCVVCSSLS